MKTKLFVLFLVVSVAFTLVGGCAGIPVDEVREINENWYKYYNQDRKPTLEEANEWDALSLEEKEQWLEDGKPVPGYLDPDYFDSTDQFYRSVEAELKLAENQDEPEPEEDEA